MLKWLIVIGLAYVFYKLMSPPKEKPEAERPRDFSGWENRAGSFGGRPSPDIKGGELVEDPQCGVYVPRASAVPGPDGKMFCSKECLEAWKEKGA